MEAADLELIIPLELKINAFKSFFEFIIIFLVIFEFFDKNLFQFFKFSEGCGLNINFWFGNFFNIKIIKLLKSLFNLYNSNNQTIGIMNIRVYPDMDLSQNEVINLLGEYFLSKGEKLKSQEYFNLLNLKK